MSTPHPPPHFRLILQSESTHQNLPPTLRLLTSTTLSYPRAAITHSVPALMLRRPRHHRSNVWLSACRRQQLQRDQRNKQRYLGVFSVWWHNMPIPIISRNQTDRGTSP